MNNSPRRPPPPNFRPPPLPVISSDDDIGHVRHRSRSERRSKNIDDNVNNNNRNEINQINKNEKPASSLEIDKEKATCDLKNIKEGSYKNKIHPHDSPTSIKTKALLKELNDMDQHFQRKTQQSSSSVIQDPAVMQSLIDINKKKISKNRDESANLISRLEQYLFLASNAAVCKAGESTLIQAGITTIIRIRSIDNIAGNPYGDRIKIIDVPDDEDLISSKFNELSDMMNELIDDNYEGVLVMSEDGSIGAALIIAYWIKYKSLGLEEAYSIIKAKRSDLKPNSGLYLKLVYFAENQKILNNMSPLQKSQKETFDKISQNWLPVTIYTVVIAILLKFLVDLML